MPNLNFLKTNRPDLYLRHIGLTKEEYQQAEDLTQEEKAELINKIIEKASANEIIEIINKLAPLELGAAPKNPFGLSDRLAPALLSAFIAKVEKDNFNDFFFQLLKTNTYETKGAKRMHLKDYPFSTATLAIWYCLNRFPGLDDSNKLFELPFCYFQQLLETHSEREEQETRKFLGKQINEFNTELCRKSDHLPFSSEEEDYNLGESEPALLKERFTKIKEQIETIDWDIPGNRFFQGGRDYNGKRVPHRIYEIIKIIENVEKNEYQITAEEAYREIIKLAQEAIANPRTGRRPSTTEVYRRIINHCILDKDPTLLDETQRAQKKEESMDQHKLTY
ncbi:hypothetical protein [Legionella jamestowniensis]|uniref:Uncharacterized protein n=1 Tax=Legionella jamestowniensis TaxID=455 RepID=A0A0W0UGB6_9GAMM|nr:hypothetical protein [Legionella jamestowniensis]KTD06946.1 hypothetical protein Ljam_1141 [Legionella jamestowniensis]SFL84691.1 hypothetical protein SAMN02746073_2227 [Legionella jamestowniensis DSM 19215]